jgi:hypothetical protein
MLYEFIQKHRIERSVVSFATDSIITTKKLGVNSTLQDATSLGMVLRHKMALSHVRKLRLQRL